MSHTFGFKKIVQFYIDGKPMGSGEVEELLGTRILQQYRDNPDKTFIVMDPRGRKYKLITRIVDEEYWKRPRHKK